MRSLAGKPAVASCTPGKAKPVDSILSNIPESHEIAGGVFTTLHLTVYYTRVFAFAIDMMNLHSAFISKCKAAYTE